MYRHRSGELSLLARGQGMLDGGVELDCFSHDPKAYSLSGKPLIRPATHTNKPYRCHKLNLPKTFVTRRGQMVLFTAPEDMIIGNSCNFHERDVSNQQAARQLKTTGRLLESAMDFHPEDNFHLKHAGGGGRTEEMGMSDSEQVLTQPGHFTNVYLNSLQKATENAKTSKDCTVEDIEESRDRELLAPCNSEAPLESECDSGLGQSTVSRPSTNSSGLSHDQPHVVPHGGKEEIHLLEGSKREDTLSALKNELFQQKPQNGSKTKKGGPKLGKKRQRRSTSSKQSANSPVPTKSKSKKMNTEPTKSIKLKRKRNKKDTQHTRHDCQSEQGMDYDHVSDKPGTDQQITAINMSPSEKLSIEGVGRVGEGLERPSGEWLSKAEEKRREVERKRAEKRELQAQKRRELEERQRLEKELSQTSKHRDTPDHLTTIIENPTDDISMTSLDTINTPNPTPETTPIHEPIHNLKQNQTPTQAHLRAELDRSKLSQHRWLLMNKREQVETALDNEIEEAERVLKLAKEAEERRRLEIEREEEQRRQQAQLKEAARFKAAEILRQSSLNPKQDNNKRLDTELTKQRHEKLFSKQSTFMFSYFNYVPPPKPRREKKLRGKAAKAKTVRTQ